VFRRMVFVRHLLDQVVLEQVLASWPRPSPGRAPAPSAREVPVDVVLFFDHVLEQRAGEFLPITEALKRTLDAVLYPVDPGHDDPLDRLGHSGFDVVREDLQLLRRIAMILLSIIVLMISWMKKGFPSDRLRIRSSMACGTASTSIRASSASVLRSL